MLLSRLAFPVRGVPLLLLPGLVMPGAASAAGNPLPHPAGVFLGYTNAPAAGRTLDEAPHLRLSVNGGPAVGADMDTGSSGVVVAAANAGAWQHLYITGTSSVSYSSSGKIMNGLKAYATVVVSDAAGHEITARNMPVLLVTGMSCMPDARNCVPGTPVGDVAMIGVGFGRERSEPIGTNLMNGNPFVHADQTASAGLDQGYVATRTGVQVGVDPATAAEDFSLAGLTPDMMHPGDWMTPSALIAGGGGAAIAGTMLVDTGYPDMLLTASAAQLAGRTQTQCESTAQQTPITSNGFCSVLKSAQGYSSWSSLAFGTRVAATLPNGTGGVAAQYGIYAGVGSAITPAEIKLTSTLAPPAFVNTGVRFLNGSDYLFDHAKGVVGYRQH